MKDKEIYEKLLKSNGIKHQIAVAIEECAELQKELTKILRGKGSRADVAGEIADVYICVEQMEQFLKVEDLVNKIRECKLERLESAFKDGESYK